MKKQNKLGSLTSSYEMIAKNKKHKDMKKSLIISSAKLIRVLDYR